MELSRFVQDLQDQLSTAAAAAGDDARAVAERLASTLESTVRLVLLEALSEAASEITAELAPGSVDVRLRGRDPQFVVTSPPGPRFEHESIGSISPLQAAAPPPAETESASEPDGADAAMTRTTLRLPESVKVRMEAAAARDGLSVNSWLVRVVGAALGSSPSTPPTPPTRSSGNRFTGWVR